MLPRNDMTGVILEPEEAQLVDVVYHNYRVSNPDTPELPVYVEGQSLSLGVDVATEVSFALREQAENLGIYAAALAGVSPRAGDSLQRERIERAMAHNMLRIDQLRRISASISRTIFDSLKTDAA